MQELKLSHRSEARLFLLLSAVSLVVTFIYVAFAEGEYWRPWVAGFLAIAGLVTACFWLYFVTRPDPALVIGPDGIPDNQAGFGLIPWEDIDHVEYIYTRHPVLGIRFKDPGKYG